jgi:hypothetical protein
MQAIVQSVLSKYFELFIVDFTADQFQLSLFRGEGILNNIEFHPQTIQEMLYIPTNLVVTKATCSLLRLQIPLYFRYHHHQHHNINNNNINIVL